MTVPQNPNTRTTAVGNGVTVVFPFDFLCLEERDLQVSVADEVLAPSQYSVGGLGQLQGGSVTFVTAPAAGVPILMESAVVAARAIDYQDNGDLFAQTVNFDFDRLWLAIKSAYGWLRRSLTLGPYDIDGQGSYRANNNRIQDLADPTAEQDAVNRRSMFSFVTEYVDKAIAGVVGGFGYFLQAGIGAVYRTFQDKMRGRVEVKDFGPIGDGTYHPLSERFATLEAAQAQYPHVTSLSQSIDWAALMAAMRTGKTVEDDGLHLIITDVWYPTRAGQQFRGAGDGITIIENPVNDDPLFCFGNPMDPNGAAPWSAVSGFALKGRVGGNTIWGAFGPNAPTLGGNPYAPGQVEGMSNNPNNVYYGRLPFTPAEWNTAARGCRMSDVTITNVYGGHAMHVSAWGFIADNVKLFSGKQGLRNSGSANSNRFDLYVSSMSMEGILHPNTDGSIPTATSYVNCIVQQCGADATGRGSIALLKGQGTQFDALYLERNNEKGSPADVFVSSSEIGCRFNSFRHTTDNETVLPVVIHTQGSGTYVGTGSFSKNVASVVQISGTDSRTETVVDGPIRPVGTNTAASGIVNDTASSLRTSGFVPDSAGIPRVQLDSRTYLYRESGKRGLRQMVGTTTELALESWGSIRMVTAGGAGTTGDTWAVDRGGVSGTGTNLLHLTGNTGTFRPGGNGTQNLGAASFPWAAVYAASSTILPSDERLKKIRGPAIAAEIRAWERVQPIIYQFLSAIAEKGEDEARLHAGYRAQTVEEAFIAEGLDPRRYALFCEDEVVDIVKQRQTVAKPTMRATTQLIERIDIIDGVPVLAYDEEMLLTPVIEMVAVVDADGNPVLNDDGAPRYHPVQVTEMVEEDVEVQIPGGKRLGLRYEECAVFEAAYMRWKVSTLEQRLAALEAK